MNKTVIYIHKTNGDIVMGKLRFIFIENEPAQPCVNETLVKDLVKNGYEFLREVWE